MHPPELQFKSLTEGYQWPAKYNGRIEQVRSKVSMRKRAWQDTSSETFWYLGLLQSSLWTLTRFTLTETWSTVYIYFTRSLLVPSYINRGTRNLTPPRASKQPKQTQQNWLSTPPSEYRLLLWNWTLGHWPISPNLITRTHCISTTFCLET